MIIDTLLVKSTHSPRRVGVGAGRVPQRTATGAVGMAASGWMGVRCWPIVWHTRHTKDRSQPGTRWITVVTTRPVSIRRTCPWRRHATTFCGGTACSPRTPERPTVSAGTRSPRRIPGNRKTDASAGRVAAQTIAAFTRSSGGRGSNAMLAERCTTHPKLVGRFL